MRIAMLVVLAGCRTSLDTADSASDAAAAMSASCAEAASHSDLAWIQTNVFTPSCAFASCHSGQASQAGHLSLQAGVARTQLVNQPATTAQSGWMRVVPSELDKSYLLVAIGHSPGPAPKDGTMPLDSSPLCQPKQDAIARWIAAGAPND